MDESGYEIFFLTEGELRFLLHHLKLRVVMEWTRGGVINWHRRFERRTEKSENETRINSIDASLN
jgi:transposase